MLKEASLVTKSGVPIWVQSSTTSVTTGILTGTMLGALSMFTTEVTGKKIRTIEMSDGVVLHIRPFAEGELNLAIVGHENILSDPQLLELITNLDSEVDLMLKGSAVDTTDAHTVEIYLESSIKKFDDWFKSKVFIEASSNKARKEQIVEISSQLALMSSRFSQEKIGVLILDGSLQSIYTVTTETITNKFYESLTAHLRGWIRVSSHNEQMLPQIIFFDDICVGIRALKNLYLVVTISWTGSIGDQKITNKVRSWISLLNRRLNP